MQNSEIILASGLLVVLATGLLWQTHRGQLRARVESRLASSLRRQGIGGRLLDQSEHLWRRRRRQREPLAELSLMLRQMGRVSTRDQVLTLGLLAAIWLGLVAGATFWAWTQTWSPRQLVAAMALAAVGSAWLMWRWLGQRIRSRARRMDEELLLVLQVIRILWDVGISVEGMLRTLCRQLRGLAPETVRELQVVQAKVDAGDAREQALGDVARLSPSEGLQDLLLLLKQAAEAGGGVADSLTALADLLQDRRRTQLQERVSKLSGRMSAVMMLLLFPALLLVLAGPGFLALMQALENVS